VGVNVFVGVKVFVVVRVFVGVTVGVNVFVGVDGVGVGVIGESQQSSKLTLYMF